MVTFKKAMSREKPHRDQINTTVSDTHGLGPMYKGLGQVVLNPRAACGPSRIPNAASPHDEC